MIKAPAGGVSLRTLKRRLRRATQAVVNGLSLTEIRTQSLNVASKLFTTSAYKGSKAVCVFLSMPKGEIDTSPIIHRVFQDGKRCFVPRCTSKTEMVMLEVKSVQDILTFEPNEWGIPEPKLDEGRKFAMDCVDVGLIVVPGVAFDRKNRRCGHGAGFYDRYFSKLKASGRPMPALVGVALRPQIVEEVFAEIHDVPMDIVISPDDGTGDAKRLVS